MTTRYSYNRRNLCFTKSKQSSSTRKVLIKSKHGLSRLIVCFHTLSDYERYHWYQIYSFIRYISCNQNLKNFKNILPLCYKTNNNNKLQTVLQTLFFNHFIHRYRFLEFNLTRFEECYCFFC